ncbi:MAG TPA: hypothetical protein VGD51_08845 [Nocardioidaceae bacterium]
MGIWDGIRKPKPDKPEKPRPEDEPTPEPRQLYDGMGAPISNPPDDAA